MRHWTPELLSACLDKSCIIWPLLLRQCQHWVNKRDWDGSAWLSPVLAHFPSCLLHKDVDSRESDKHWETYPSVFLLPGLPRKPIIPADRLMLATVFSPNALIAPGILSVSRYEWSRSLETTKLLPTFRDQERWSSIIIIRSVGEGHGSANLSPAAGKTDKLSSG